MGLDIKSLMQETNYHRIKTIQRLHEITHASLEECARILKPYYKEYERMQAQTDDDTGLSDSDESAHAYIDLISHILSNFFTAADRIDDTPVGLKRKTKGLQTTREAAKRDIFHFLLYIANTDGIVNNGETAFLNIVTGENWCAEQYEQLWTIIGTPYPSKMVSLSSFMDCDHMVESQRAFEDNQGFVYLLTQSYQTLGNLINVLDENTSGVNKVDRFISDINRFVSANS